MLNRIANKAIEKGLDVEIFISIITRKNRNNSN